MIKGLGFSSQGRITFVVDDNAQRAAYPPEGGGDKQLRCGRVRVSGASTQFKYQQRLTYMVALAQLQLSMIKNERAAVQPRPVQPCFLSNNPGSLKIDASC